MEVTASMAFRLDDRSGVAEARRGVGMRARELGWSETACGASELVATELATNLVKHGRDGILALASAADGSGEDVLVVVAVDRGPGIADVAKSFTDGFSTAGSPGTGLGAVKRLAYDTDVLSAAEGTVVIAELRDRAPAREGRRAPVRLAGFAVPKDGEIVCGDAWSFRWRGQSLAIVVCDGLGHGYEASRAAARAVERFEGDDWESPRQALELMNEELRPTRGAAAAVALVDSGTRRVRYCAVGNIVGGIVTDDRVQHLVSHNGIVGGAARIAEFEYAWPPGATLILHSDGLTARWQTARWGAVWHRHPALIAGIAYRDLNRGTDDAVVVVANDHAISS